MQPTSTLQLATTRRYLQDRGDLALLLFFTIGSALACLDTTRLETHAKAGPSYSRELTRISGHGQSGRVQTSLPEPLVVLVTDTSGQPSADVLVLFRVVQGEAHLPGKRVMVDSPPGEAIAVATDDSGKASVPMILGAQAGTTTVVAEVFFDGAQTVRFTADAVY